MINNIKQFIINNKNKKVRIKVNNIRNKCEYVDGTVTEIYDRIFIVSSNDNLKRSFSYSDILIGNIQFY